MPQLGERKTFPNGTVGEWDGADWVPASGGGAQTQPQVGARKQFPNGAMGEWDGSDWVPMDFNTAHRRNMPGEVRGDEANLNQTMLEKGVDLADRFNRTMSDATNPLNHLVGAAKSAGQTAYSLMGGMAIPGTNNMPFSPLGIPNPDAKMPSFLETKGAGQKVGAAMEQGGEFMLLPETRLAKGAGLVSKGVRAVAKMGLEGGKAATVAELHGEDPTAAGVGTAAIVGAAGPVGGALKWAGSKAGRVVGSLIKPSEALFKFGADPIEGARGIVANSFDDMGQQLSAKRDQIGQAIDATLSTASNGHYRGIPLRDMIAKSVGETMELAKDHGVPTEQLQRILTRWLDRAHPYMDGSGIATPMEATVVMRQLGDALRNFKESGEIGTASSSAIQNMYHKIGAAIDMVVPKVKTLNKAYSNTIMAQSAVTHMEHASQTSNLAKETLWATLKDWLGGGPAAKTRLALALDKLGGVGRAVEGVANPPHFGMPSEGGFFGDQRRVFQAGGRVQFNPAGLVEGSVEATEAGALPAGGSQTRPLLTSRGQKMLPAPDRPPVYDVSPEGVVNASHPVTNAPPNQLETWPRPENKTPRPQAPEVNLTPRADVILPSDFNARVKPTQELAKVLMQNGGRLRVSDVLSQYGDEAGRQAINDLVSFGVLDPKAIEGGFLFTKTGPNETAYLVMDNISRLRKLSMRGAGARIAPIPVQ